MILLVSVVVTRTLMITLMKDDESINNIHGMAALVLLTIIKQ